MKSLKWIIARGISWQKVVTDELYLDYFHQAHNLLFRTTSTFRVLLAILEEVIRRFWQAMSFTAVTDPNGSNQDASIDDLLQPPSHNVRPQVSSYLQALLGDNPPTPGLFSAASLRSSASDLTISHERDSLGLQEDGGGQSGDDDKKSVFQDTPDITNFYAR